MSYGTIIVLLIFTVQEWQREEQAEWMPVEFQGDALSDAEENAIKKAVTGGIIPYKLEYHKYQ